MVVVLPLLAQAWHRARVPQTLDRRARAATATDTPGAAWFPRRKGRPMPRRSAREILTFAHPGAGHTRHAAPPDAPEGPAPALTGRLQRRDTPERAPLPAPQPTVPAEGQLAEWPLWAFRKKQQTVTRWRIAYEDGTYVQLTAPAGLPSVRAPGYLDVLWAYGQQDLWRGPCVAMAVDRVLSQVHQGPVHGKQARGFVRDMQRLFALSLETDRLLDPVTQARRHTASFRVLDGLEWARHGQEESRFYFNAIVLRSLRSGYFRRVDFDFCLFLDRHEEPLARFLYAYLTQRLEEARPYHRSLAGFVTDIGLGSLARLPLKRQTARVTRTVVPALALLKGHAYAHYELDERGTMVFYPRETQA